MIRGVFVLVMLMVGGCSMVIDLASRGRTTSTQTTIRPVDTSLAMFYAAEPATALTPYCVMGVRKFSLVEQHLITKREMGLTQGDAQFTLAMDAFLTGISLGVAGVFHYKGHGPGWYAAATPWVVGLGWGAVRAVKPAREAIVVARTSLEPEFDVQYTRDDSLPMAPCVAFDQAFLGRAVSLPSGRLDAEPNSRELTLTNGAVQFSSDDLNAWARTPSLALWVQQRGDLVPLLVNRCAVLAQHGIGGSAPAPTAADPYAPAPAPPTITTVVTAVDCPGSGTPAATTTPPGAGP